MRRTPAPAIGAPTAGVVAVALAAAALTGCSSSSGSSDGKPEAPAATTSAAPATTKAEHVDGHLDFTGSSTGGADFTGGVKCELLGDKFLGVTSPDTDLTAMTKARPRFIAAVAPSQVAMLVTPDGTNYSTSGSAQGVSGHKSGGVWTVTVSNLRIGSMEGSASVTVNGSLTCTDTSTGK